MGRAFDIATMLVRLGMHAFELIRAGRPERVEAIIPVDLETTLAKAAADLKAEARFAGVP